MDALSGPKTPLQAGQLSSDEARIKAAADEMEAVFLGMVVNEMMKETMSENMSGGHGEEMFRSLLGNEIGAEIAKSTDLGIARSIEEGLRAYKK